MRVQYCFIGRKVRSFVEEEKHSPLGIDVFDVLLYFASPFSWFPQGISSQPSQVLRWSNPMGSALLLPWSPVMELVRDLLKESFYFSIIGPLCNTTVKVSLQGDGTMLSVPQSWIHWSGILDVPLFNTVRSNKCLNWFANCSWAHELSVHYCKVTGPNDWFKRVYLAWI